MNKKILAITGALAVLAIAAWAYLALTAPKTDEEDNKKTTETEKTTQTVQNNDQKTEDAKNEDKTVVFTCPSNKSITATFHLPTDETIDLSLSDGRKLTLTHAVSASGARYANSDESFVFWNKGDSAFVEENGTTTYENCLTGNQANASTTDNVGLANPASANCKNAGGQTMIQKRADGGEYGLCLFDDNRACEEWAMTRGDCPAGGVKTTGYDTEEQKYCAWLGGQTTTDPGAVCTFADKSTCALAAFYAGSCQKGDSLKNSQAETGKYTVEKILDKTCVRHDECETPEEYMVQSRCPFTAKCLEGKCTVICPSF